LAQKPLLHWPAEVQAEPLLSVEVDEVQLPLLQVCPAEHALPQVPQLFGSV
jgi:hypothetical protein